MLLAGIKTSFSDSGCIVDVKIDIKKNLMARCLARRLWIGLVVDVKTYVGSTFAMDSLAKSSTIVS